MGEHMLWPTDAVVSGLGLTAASTEEGTCPPQAPALPCIHGSLLGRRHRVLDLTTAPSRTWDGQPTQVVSAASCVHVPCPQAEHLYSLLGTT